MIRKRSSYLQVIQYKKENQVRWYGNTIFEVTSKCIDGWLIPSIKAKSRISAQKAISEGSIFFKAHMLSKILLIWAVVCH